MAASSQHAAHQCLQQLIEYVGLYRTLPYVTDFLPPLRGKAWLAKACLVHADMNGCH